MRSILTYVSQYNLTKPADYYLRINDIDVSFTILFHRLGFASPYIIKYNQPNVSIVIRTARFYNTIQWQFSNNIYVILRIDKVDTDVTDAVLSYSVESHYGPTKETSDIDALLHDAFLKY